jgi:hypothetical protein
MQKQLNQCRITKQKMKVKNKLAKLFTERNIFWIFFWIVNLLELATFTLLFACILRLAMDEFHSFLIGFGFSVPIVSVLVIVNLDKFRHTFR